MAKKPIINIITTQCPTDDEVKFNKWYNEVHIPMLMKYQGCEAGSPLYKVLGCQRSAIHGCVSF